MNLLLLTSQQLDADQATLTDPRQLKHIHTHLKLSVGDSIKIGVRDGHKGTAQVAAITEKTLVLYDIVLTESPPSKLPLTLIIALPRPKVLRRLIMDSVTLGVEKIILLHSYRVDKSYWQTPFLQQLDHYVDLGLEQAGDTAAPEIQLHKRFKPFVEDILPEIAAARPAYAAHPYAAEKMPSGIAHPCSIVIGPEGGFIPYEIDLLMENGCRAVSLGSRIIRTETVIPYVLGRLFSL